MDDAVIVSAVRTAVGRAPAGTLRATRPDDLASVALSEALKRAPGVDPRAIDDVILGRDFKGWQAACFHMNKSNIWLRWSIVGRTRLELTNDSRANDSTVRSSVLLEGSCRPPTPPMMPSDGHGERWSGAPASDGRSMSRRGVSDLSRPAAHWSDGAGSLCEISSGMFA